MATIIHVPQNKLFYISEIYAFISTDAKGNEGVCGTMMGGTFMPMIAADAERLEQLMPKAQILADTQLMKITLIKLSTRTEVRVIEPKKQL